MTPFEIFAVSWTAGIAGAAVFALTGQCIDLWLQWRRSRPSKRGVERLRGLSDDWMPKLAVTQERRRKAK